MSKWIDVTRQIRPDIAVWPGERKPVFDQRSTVEKDGVQVTRLEFGAHTGTHIDAPCHFIAGGGGIDSVPLEKLTGRCTLIHYQGESPVIEIDDLPPLNWDKVERVVFRTRNSLIPDGPDFAEDYVALSLATAKFLVEKDIQLVGIDYLSVEGYPSKAGHPVHTTLLKAGVVVVEGLNLQGLEAGEYEIMALPLPLVGRDGSPARVLMRAL